jgi:hypothetical protein
VFTSPSLFPASNTAAVVSLKAEAASRGVPDLEAALVVANATAPRAAAAATPLSRLVEAMLKLKSLDGIIVHKEGIALLMPGSTGIHVGRQGNVAVRRRLESLIKRLTTELIRAGTLPESYANGMPESSAEYARGLKEVRTDVVSSLRFQVESQAAKRLHLTHALERAEGHNNADKYRKGLKRCGNNIGSLLRTLSTWEVYGTDQPPPWEATEAIIRAAGQGNFPWAADSDGDGTSPAVQRYFGVRYRSAVAQVARAEEETKYLQMEVVRLFNGLDGRIKAVETNVEGLQKLGEAVERRGGWAAAREARVLAGRIQLVGLERERLEMIRDAARVKLTAHLPVAA